MLAKVTILFAALVAVNAWAGGLVSTGVSNNARTQDAFGNYAFGYDIKDGLGASNSRSEVGDAVGNKKGSYTIADIDGRARRVDYVADGLGFRATVKTNEPGTAASAPAAALINSLPTPDPSPQSSTTWLQQLPLDTLDWLPPCCWCPSCLWRSHRTWRCMGTWRTWTWRCMGTWRTWTWRCMGTWTWKGSPPLRTI
ncbi:adult-specific rigid cuticular protein 15.7 [Caerostris extrusa]|uniref:Adult-specific rigid cuticular protein 15.7 n=1 Tax=Caerostris extrusa TaxID=172846 RepID=A0AAV4PME0_CAEEX|nr:adult-specific rigid cuticular protein 15.7 [Caerostris extrusa]